MKSFMGWVRNKSMMLITYAVLLSLISVIFVYKQQSLIPGANVYENKVVARVNNYEYPWKNAVDAPYITSVWLVTKTGVSTLRSARTISAIASVLSILLFFQLLRNWLLSPGKALVGTVLFATSSWTLIIGRGAHSATVGSFLLLLIFTLGTRLLFTTKPFFDWLFLIIATILALYSPAIIWLVFLTGVVSLLHYKQRQRSLPLKTWHKIIIALTALILLAPLVLSLISHPAQGLTLLGISSVAHSIPELFLNVSDAVKAIFFINTSASPLGLGKTPMLDIFSVFMFLLGCYYFERRLSLKRSKMLFGGLAIGLVVCTISGFDLMRLSLLLPLVYIFIAAGIHESISRWLAVFPRNPIARGLGVVVLSVAIGFVASYHLDKMFIVRPGNPEIRALYSVK
jgi:hypothetical protein